VLLHDSINCQDYRPMGQPLVQVSAVIKFVLLDFWT